MCERVRVLVWQYVGLVCHNIWQYAGLVVRMCVLRLCGSV